MKSLVNQQVDQNESSRQVCMLVGPIDRCDIYHNYFFVLYMTQLLVAQEEET